MFVVGMEDGLFPGNRAMGDEEEMGGAATVLWP